MTAPHSVRIIRWLCAIVFVCGIAGIIVSSINGNNNGWVVTIGVTTSIAAIILIVVSTVSTRQRIHVFDEVEAEQLETKINEQVQRGASEEALRDIVRRAIDLGRKTA
jgi:Na+/melibiose symporter-like transporter